MYLPGGKPAITLFITSPIILEGTDDIETEGRLLAVVAGGLLTLLVVAVLALVVTCGGLLFTTCITLFSTSTCNRNALN